MDDEDDEPIFAPIQSQPFEVYCDIPETKTFTAPSSVVYNDPNKENK